jgi:hypothetical protein
MNRELISGIKITNLGAPQTAGTSAVNSSEIDMANYAGAIFLTSIGTSAANNSFKVQGSDTSGSGHADITGAVAQSEAANETRLGVSVHRPRKRYLRTETTRTTSTTSGDIWCIQYGARKKEVANTIATAMKMTQVCDA